MATFTLCSKLVKHCSQNHKYVSNILYVFFQENEFKIALDNSDAIIKAYKEILKSDDKYYVDVKRWIEIISFQEDSYEMVKNVEKFKTEPELFIHICHNTFDKKLLVESKQDYLQYSSDILSKKLNIYDKDDGITELSKPKTINKIIQQSFGDNSPNIAVNE